MIISDTYRYVFIELPRSASTAVNYELREYYDGRRILAKHATYRDFLRQANPAERGYFAFSGIRNPLDVAVSRYSHLKSNPHGRFTDVVELAKRRSMPQRLENRIHAWVQRNDATFEQFLLHWYLMPYDTWASLDHHRMDAILRFESLADDFEQVLAKLDIRPVRRLPVINVTPARSRDFVSEYTPRAIARAVWVFGPYMEEWGYVFPPEWGDVRIPQSSRVFMRAARLLRGVYWSYVRRSDYLTRGTNAQWGAW
jgi:hypothetical protein